MWFLFISYLPSKYLLQHEHSYAIKLIFLKDIATQIIILSLYTFKYYTLRLILFRIENLLYVDYIPGWIYILSFPSDGFYHTLWCSYQAKFGYQLMRWWGWPWGMREHVLWEFLRWLIKWGMVNLVKIYWGVMILFTSL